MTYELSPYELSRLHEVCVRLPNDPKLKPAWGTYKPSQECLQLPSERKRSIFAEELLEKEPPVPKLVLLCLRVIAENYRRGPLLPPPLDTNDMINMLCDLLPIDLPLIDLFTIDNNIYWKRVFMGKTSDKFMSNIMGEQHNTDWKSLGITQKYRELIENTDYESWNFDRVDEISQRVKDYVTELNITKMKTIKKYSIDKGEFMDSFEITNYPPDICHHGNLKVLGELTNLVSLSLEFSPHEMQTDFEPRFMEFSYNDAVNLSNGLRSLENLKILKLRNSRFDSKKFKVLAEGFFALALEELEFYFCRLNDECSLTIFKILQCNKNLKKLTLAGNNFRIRVPKALAFGIQYFEGKLDYLDISRNPLKDEAITYLIRGVIGVEQINHLNVTGIGVTSEGAALISEFIKEHKYLQKVDMVAVPITEDGGDRLIKCLKDNVNVIHLDYRGCGLSINQEYQMEILLKRNRYILENPYLREEEKNNWTTEEIEAWVNRVKNKVYLEAEDEFRQNVYCKSLVLDAVRAKSFMPSIFKAREEELVMESEEKIGSFMIRRTDNYQFILL
ncbi:hypothetical protein ACFFRR_003464 [Megaselia abdita]